VRRTTEEGLFLGTWGGSRKGIRKGFCLPRGKGRVVKEFENGGLSAGFPCRYFPQGRGKASQGKVGVETVDSEVYKSKNRSY